MARKDETEGSHEWVAHPRAAVILRVVIAIAPALVAVAASYAVARVFADELRSAPAIQRILSLAGLGFVAAFTVDRLLRRLLPLAALLNLALAFPDEAPSRFGIALRSATTKQLERKVREFRRSGLGGDVAEHGALVLELAAGLSHHDRLTRGHCERVRAYADLIGEEMGLTDEQRDKLRWSALIHDAGKIFVPTEILNSPDRPTEVEWEILKSHTTEGERLAAPLRPWLGAWTHAVGCHHERWDGEGYPRGLKGEQIPLAARIVAVADTYDVLVSRRSYKAPMSADQARAEIARCSGTQFDPRVARAFLQVGVRRPRWAVGPLASLANLPTAAQFPIGVGGHLTAANVLALTLTAGAVAVGSNVPAALPDVLSFSDNESAVVTTTVEAGNDSAGPTASTTLIAPTSTTAATAASNSTSSTPPTTATLAVEAPATSSGTATSTPSLMPTTTAPGPTKTTAPQTTSTIRTRPATWTLSPFAGKLLISEVLPATDGNVGNNVVELYNAGPDPIDLSGFRITDYTFPAQDLRGTPSVLAPGRRVVVWTYGPWGAVVPADGTDLQFAAGPSDGAVVSLALGQSWLEDAQGRLVDWFAWVAPGWTGEIPPPPTGISGTIRLEPIQLSTDLGDRQSIALRPGGNPTAVGCWEPTGSGTAGSTCPGSGPTIDSDGGLRVASIGSPNG